MEQKIVTSSPADYILTCIGPEIPPPFFENLSSLLLEEKVTICQSRKLAERQVHCIEFSLAEMSGTGQTHRSAPTFLMKALSPLRKRFGVDLVIQDIDAYALPKKLVVMDLDSTLIQAEVIDELAKEAGVGEKVVEITRRAMNGEIYFPDALRERVHLLKGLPVTTLETVYKRILFTPGTIEFIATLKKRKYKTAVLTGGFDYFAGRYKEKLKLDYAFSNGLEIKDNLITGEVSGEIVDGQKKVSLMEEIAMTEGIELNSVVAIGDGANDLPMIKRAGLGIAFNAKPSVAAAAPNTITQTSLTCILHLLGISEAEI